jgi:hypothetical protein
MKHHTFFIDKITNGIVEVRTGKRFNTVIVPLNKSDLRATIKKNGWRFSWRNEWKNTDHHVYKLVIEGGSIIQGLISLQAFANYIEMHLIESAPHNYGRLKKYAGVAGNLVAFACKMSYDCGYSGNVGFMAKTMLIRHYMDAFGADLLFKNRMSISGKSAEKLVNLFYKNYFDGR